MSGIPTESRIFADRYLRETRRLEKQHAGLLTPGAENWTEALRDIAPRLSGIGSPIKRVAALRSQVVDVLNEIAATPEAIRHLGLRYRQASRSATFDFATFSADPNPIAGAGDEDGLSILMHRIRCDRRSVELITNIHIAYIARHAIGRLHERQRNLTGWKATVAFVLVGALGYLTRNSEAHADSALHLRLDDVLLVGSSKPAVKRASDGEDYDNTLIDVRTTLSADEGCDPAALEQGRIATRVALEWLAQRGETRKLAETIPPLAWRGGDFTSRVAVSKVQSVDQRMRLKCGVGFRQLRTCRRTRPGAAMCKSLTWLQTRLRRKVPSVTVGGPVTRLKSRAATVIETAPSSRRSQAIASPRLALGLRQRQTIPYQGDLRVPAPHIGPIDVTRRWPASP